MPSFLPKFPWSAVKVLFVVLVLTLGFSIPSQLAHADDPTPGKGQGPSGTASTQTSLRAITSNPLTINVGTDGSAQIFYAYNPPVSPNGQFFPPAQTLADQGIFLWIGASAYGPNTASRSSAYGSATTPFTEISQTAVTGSGTAADPFAITNVLGAGATGVTLTQRITYVAGNGFYRMDTTISNTSAASVSVTYFHAGDIYLKGSDTGFGYYDPSSGSVGGKTAAQDWFVIFQPITPATKYEEDFYATIWTDIGHGGAQGPGFHNTIVAGSNIDNGAGLQWSNLAIGVGGSTTVSDFLSFGSTATIVGPTPTPAPPAPPPVPEADTLLLFGGGLSALTGYAVLRVRARGRRRASV